MPSAPSTLIDNDAVRRIGALDGLRAFAVVAVIVYHLDITWSGRRVLSGGFLGVDLFFVLSGYLIATLITREVARSSRIDLGRFWARRFRRLMPASLVLMLAVVVWGVVVGWGRSIDGDILASVFWVQNWHLITADQPYIAQFTDPSPLTHFWSLSIEEQWYVIFPLMAFAAKRWIATKPVLVAGVVFAAAIASMTAMGLLYETGSWRAYFGTDTRVFALMIGCALAILPATGSDSPMSRRTAIGCLLSGLVGWTALVAVAGDTDTWMYPWGFIAAAVTSAAVVVGAAVSKVSWFDNAVIQWMGTRSYGLYLWHWPVFVALDADRVGRDGIVLVAVRLVVTVLLTEASFRLVEQPIRTGGRLRLPASRLIPLGLAASVAVAGVAIVAPIDVPRGGSADVLADAEDAANASTTLPTTGDSLDLLVVGDSVAFGLGYGTDASTASGTPVTLTNAAMPGCGLTRLPRPDSTYLVDDVLTRCLDLAREWSAAIEANSPDAAVYVVGPYDNLDVLDGDTPVTAGSSEWESLVGDRLAESFGVLTADGTPLIVVVPGCRTVEPEVEGMPELTAALVRQLTSLVETTADRFGDAVSVVDPTDWQCGADGEPLDLDNGSAVRDDGVHYTEAGKQAFWGWLTPIALETVATRPAPSDTPAPTTDPSGPSAPDDGVTTTSTLPAPTRTVLVVGDSTAGSLVRGATDAAAAAGITLSSYYFPGCSLVGGDLIRPDGGVAQPAGQCESFRSGLAAAATSTDPDVVVILLANYEGYDRGTPDGVVAVGTPEYETFLRGELDRIATDATRGEVPTIVLTPPCLAPSGADASTTGVYSADRTSWLAGVFARYVADRPFQAVVGDLQAYVCPGGLYLDTIDGTTLYSDGVRYSPDGAAFVWAWLEPQVDALSPAE
jgi:peptidoglycan/LPS O-acetylase OafA/YrhL